MTMDPAHLWRLLGVGYLLTIAIETPILLALLSRPHRWTRRMLAGVWLTACTYPVVVLVLPPPQAAKTRAGAARTRAKRARMVAPYIRPGPTASDW